MKYNIIPKKFKFLCNFILRLLFVLMVVGNGISSLVAEEVESIYYFVNDDIVSKLDFESRYKVFLKEPSAQKYNEEEGRELTISNQIFELLVKQKLSEEDLVVSQLDVSNQINLIMQGSGLTELSAFKSAIEQSLKIDYNDYVKTVRRKLNYDIFLNKLVPSSPPSKQEVADYYERNRRQYQVSNPLYNLSLIFLEVPQDASFSQKRKVESKLQEIFTKLKSSEISFEQAVSLYSQDLSTQNNNGLMGWVDLTQRRMSPLQMKSIGALGVGEVSKPMAMIGGVGLYKLNDKKTSGDIPKEMALVLVRRKIIGDRKAKLSKQVIADMYKQSYIKKNTEALSYQPEN